MTGETKAIDRSAAGEPTDKDHAGPDDTASCQARGHRWHRVREKGSILGIRALLFVVTVFGRTVGRAIVAVVIAYYVLFHRSVRRVSRDYLGRVGIAPTLRNVYRHVLTFGQVTLDRIFLVQGKTAPFRVTTNGHQHLAALRDSRRGAILVGAHLGSFEAMRARGDEEALPIHIVANFGNARMINGVLRSLDPTSRVRVMDMGEGGLDFMLRIREVVEKGELIAIMGDRVGDDTRTAVVPFLGARAELPVGVYLLASMLKCPVYVTFGLYRGKNHYDLYCEPFAEQIVLPRKARDEALERYAAQYAEVLERFVKKAPLNWFNFYDFFS